MIDKTTLPQMKPLKNRRRKQSSTKQICGGVRIWTQAITTSQTVLATAWLAILMQLGFISTATPSPWFPQNSKKFWVPTFLHNSQILLGRDMRPAIWFWEYGVSVNKLSYLSNGTIWGLTETQDVKCSWLLEQFLFLPSSHSCTGAISDYSFPNLTMCPFKAFPLLPSSCCR